MKEGRLCLGVKGPVTIPKALKFGFFLVEKKFGTGTALFVLFKSLTVPLFLSARDFDRDEGSRVRRQIIARYRNFQCFLFPLR